MWSSSRYGAGLRSGALLFPLNYSFPQPMDVEAEEEDAASNYSDNGSEGPDDSDEALLREDLEAVELDLPWWEQEENNPLLCARRLLELDEDSMPSSFNFLHWALSVLADLYHRCVSDDAQTLFEDFYEELRSAIYEDDGSLVNEQCVVTGLTPLLCLYASPRLFWTERDCSLFLERHVVPLTLLLLERGADINAVDRSGKGVFDFFVGENASFVTRMWSNVVLALFRDKGVYGARHLFLQRAPLVGDGSPYPSANEPTFGTVLEARVAASEFRDLMAGTDATEAEVEVMGGYLLEALVRLMDAAEQVPGYMCTMLGTSNVLHVWQHFLGLFAGRRTL